MAELLGKEAALWLPTGTMANRAALRTLTRAGRRGRRQPRVARLARTRRRGSQRRRADPRDRRGRHLQRRAAARRVVKPRHIPIFPTTTLVEVENTHNRAGGIVFPQAEVLRHLRRGARARLGDLLDGARLERERGDRRGKLVALVALVRPRRGRVQQGPGRAWWLAAGGSKAYTPRRRAIASAWAARCARTASSLRRKLHALDHHLARLVDDHATRGVRRAPAARAPVVLFDLATVQTNIVVLPPRTVGADRRADDLPRGRGTVASLVNAFAARTVRAVTHLDVDRPQRERAADTIAALLAS